MFRRFESGVGRGFGFLLAWFVASLLGTAVVGIFGASNLFWGEDNQYGIVDIPGSKVLHFPGGSVKVSAAVLFPGRGNATPDLPIPSDLSLTVSPVSGNARPTVHQDLGSSSNAGGSHVDTQRQVYTVDIPSDGDYRVTAAGDFTGDGVNPEMWFGHDPPVSGAMIPILGAAIGLVALLVLGLVVPAARRRRRGHGPAATLPSQHSSVADQVDDPGQLERLGALHRQGVVTDAELASEKAKILGDR